MNNLTEHCTSTGTRCHSACDTDPACPLNMRAPAPPNPELMTALMVGVMMQGKPTDTPAPTVEALRQAAVLAVGDYVNFPTTLNRQRIYACIDDLTKAATDATARAERAEQALLFVWRSVDLFHYDEAHTVVSDVVMTMPVASIEAVPYTARAERMEAVVDAARECVATGQRDWLTAEWSYLVEALNALDAGATADEGERGNDSE